jgi:hypothetical protein
MQAADRAAEGADGGMKEKEFKMGEISFLPPEQTAVVDQSKPARLTYQPEELWFPVRHWKSWLYGPR